MNKKLMTLALAAVIVAIFALPAVASAGNWHLEPTDGSRTGPTITITATSSTLSTTSGLTIKSTGLSGTGTFNAESTTTGVITSESAGIKGGLKFTGVASLGFPCTSAGQAAGTVLTAPLTFHLEKIDTETPGLLIYPGGAEGSTFATFTCAGITTIVRGNGILGDVTDKCSEEKEKGTVDFQTNGTNGHQKYKQVTTNGTVYDLEASQNGGSTWSTAAIEATASLTLSKKSKVNCTLP
jgi:hypothetical protein